MGCQRLQRHTGGIGLAVGRVACDVRCTYIASLQQLEVDIGLVFPYVDDALRYLTHIESLPQGFGIGSLATRGVDEIHTLFALFLGIFHGIKGIFQYYYHHIPPTTFALTK